MKWKDIKAEISRLPFEEQVIGGASLLLSVSCFLPWYFGRSKNAYINMNGFQSFAFIIGYFVFGLALLNLLYFGYKILKGKEFRLPFVSHHMFMFVGGQSLILLIVALFIYTKQTFEFSQAQVRFGLYLGLISALFVTVFSYFFLRRSKMEIAKKKAQQLFEYNHKENVKLTPESYGESEHSNRGQNIYKQAVNNINEDQIIDPINISSGIGVSENINQLSDQNDGRLTVEKVSNNVPNSVL